MISNAPDRFRAVVFVHGWGGSAETTWYRFQELVDDGADADLRDWWSKADLYFYGYESRRFSVAEHAASFLAFLDKVFPNPAALLSAPPNTGDRAFGYRELYLVGHSLGGVVLREGILDRVAIAEAKQRPATTSTALLDSYIRLFAPAMHGARPSGWLGLAYHLLSEIRELKPWFKSVAESTTILRQLMSDSDKLVRLRDSTDELAVKTRYRALAADVVYGENEHIVERDKFRMDRLPDKPVPGMNHTSVCKPQQRYRFPLRFVVSGVGASMSETDDE
jgi:pimeloyl-ACP methyl ester carboxylesterase